MATAVTESGPRRQRSTPGIGRWWNDSFVTEDLNRLAVPTDSEAVRPFEDPSTLSDDGTVEVVFRNIEARLIAEIQKFQLVIGCVAWLTSSKVLAALASVRGVAILVQKEDFLRPDLGVSDEGKWKTWLHTAYGRLPHGPVRYAYGGTIVPGLSFAGDVELDPIRCVGNHNSDRRAAMPRSHHKFLVFCDVLPATGHGFEVVEPRKVWTGSYNPTKTGGRSLENAVILSDPGCVHAYYEEWGQLVGISEPLDWTSSYVQPDLRIGT